jgi:predicted short-subunit dehydrogenase-like oxidoreductase (DUF2520 family)
VNVLVLGYGQLGRALAAALAARRADRVCVWTRREVPEPERTAGVSFRSRLELAAAVDAADLMVLGAPDSALCDLVENLRALPIAWNEKAVLHASGVATPAVLRPLAELGAATAACHPLRAFPRGRPDSGEAFEGTLFTIDGAARGAAAARRLVAALGGIPLDSRVTDRSTYHLAATLASNYGLLLRDWSARRFVEAGLAPGEASRAADALLSNALENARAAPGGLPLSGAIRRGDVATVEAHVSRLSGAELLAYSALGLLLVDSVAPRAEGDAAERLETARTHLTRLLREAASRALDELRPQAVAAAGGSLP